MSKRKRNGRRKFGKAKGWHQIKREEHATRKNCDRTFAISKVSEDRMKLTFKCVRKENIPQCYSNYFVVTKKITSKNELKMNLRCVRDSSASGYRLFSVSKFEEHVNNLIEHTANCERAKNLHACGKNSFHIHKDVKHQGLATVLLGECLGCNRKFCMDSSEKIQTVNKKEHYDVNVRSVWGTMVSGRGNASINELCASLDMPGMSGHTFTNIECEIGELWEQVLLQDLLEAGIEERKIAVEKGRFFQGIPAITVVCDGGWSKRSHRHTYNAMGGVAIIAGAATGKLLYVGVRNKYCSICSRAENKKQDPPKHECFKNWKSSSQAMESDIILDGFLKAESMHGVRYMEIIGDGDSSVYSRISEEVPVWGSYVTKVECANHICKCLRSNLEHLIEDNKEYRGKMFPKPFRGKLVAIVRSAITFRHEQSLSDPSLNKFQLQQLLKNDILNSFDHMLKDHTKCSDFCVVTRKKNSTDVSKTDATASTSAKDIPECTSPQISGVPDLENPDNAADTNVDSIECVLEEQLSLWNSLDVSDNFLTFASSFSPSENLKKDVFLLLNRVASKAHRLLDDATTNLVESWMAIRMKFDGGKVFNRCSRGSWHYRCYGGALRKNFGPSWAPIVWESTIGTSAGEHFHKHYSQREHHHEVSLKNQKKPQYKRRRLLRKLSSAKDSDSVAAKQAYGPLAVDVVPDVTQEQLQQFMDSYLAKEIMITDSQMAHISDQTKAQSLCGYWMDERKKRLTASNFADVVKQSPSISIKPLLQRLLYSTFTGNRLTRKGLRLEKYAIIEYQRYKQLQNESVSVNSVGLYISREHPFLAASPDGIVESDIAGKGLIEIKHVLLNKTCSFEEAVEKNKTFCLELVDRQLRLKTNHKFWYQVQGQLNILNIAWLDFVVRRVDPHQLHVQRIYRDTDLWQFTMLPKLKAFYMKAVLPELAKPRHGISPGIREPGIWGNIPRGILGSEVILVHCGEQLNKSPVLFVEYDLVTNALNSSKASKRDNIQFSASTEVVKKNIRKLPIPSATQTAPTATQPSESLASRTRKRRQIFLGRYISHEWLDDFGRSKWYSGYVTSVLDGTDGQTPVVYEVLYDNFDEPYEVDHLVEDFESNSVVFLDL